MTLLPVVGRELRAAARRKGTFRARWWTAAIATIATLFTIMMLNIATVRAQGGSLFAGLTGLAFGLTLLAGVLLTADALSEERRMGTLGLLFLTDLKGYDVVLGKLVATSLNAAYGLLALVPVLGLALLLGGVTGTELARVALALLNSLFVSLAAGLAVSAFSRDGQRAMSNTLGLLFLLVFVVPFLASTVQWEFGKDLIRQLAALSPLHAFHSATRFSVSSSSFLMHLLVSNLVGWAFLALASWRLPRFALDHETRDKQRPGPLPGHQPRPERSDARRQRLLAVNPVLWLLSTEPATRLLTWLIVAAWVLVVIAFSWLFDESSLLVFHGAKVCGFVLKILIAIQACRFFAQARVNGALEMLAATPLTNAEVLKGQWLHLKRLFLWPLVVFWGTNFVPLVFGALADFAVLASEPGPTMLFPYLGITGFAVWTTAGFVLDIITVSLVGVRLALTMRKPSLAPACTILFVLVLPLFLCWFDILVDIILSVWAYSSLKADFRYSSPGLIARH